MRRGVVRRSRRGWGVLPLAVSADWPRGRAVRGAHRVSGRAVAPGRHERHVPARITLSFDVSEANIQITHCHLQQLQCGLVGLLADGLQDGGMLDAAVRQPALLQLQSQSHSTRVPVQEQIHCVRALASVAIAAGPPTVVREDPQDLRHTDHPGAEAGKRFSDPLVPVLNVTQLLILHLRELGGDHHLGRCPPLASVDRVVTGSICDSVQRCQRILKVRLSLRHVGLARAKSAIQFTYLFGVLLKQAIAFPLHIADALKSRFANMGNLILQHDAITRSSLRAFLMHLGDFALEPINFCSDVSFQVADLGLQGIRSARACRPKLC
mmetsp:Transcript_6655/g.15944  ORF Transcript_6655/g.15944 Transcript_6655/m.15944 type:complete len:324 (-) Transcript_6655:1726-2697(-)